MQQQFSRSGSIKEVANENGVCVRTIYNAIAAGKLRSVKIGNRRLIPPDERTRLQQEGTG